MTICAASLEFLPVVRSRKPSCKTCVRSQRSARLPYANESYYRKSPVYWDAASQSIKS